MSETPEHPSLAVPEGVSPYAWQMSDEYRARLKSGAYLTPETHCARCIAAGHPDSFGSPVDCGFKPDGTFQRDWNCATVGLLRGFAYEHDSALRWDDSSAALVPLPGAFIVLEYYKDRGATEHAYVIDHGTHRPMTRDDAERAIAYINGTLDDEA